MQESKILIREKRESLPRREFLRWMLGGTCLCACSLLNGYNPFSSFKYLGIKTLWAEENNPPEEMFFRKLDSLKIECGTCHKKCQVADGKRGYCGNKENRGGRYYTLVYNKICAAHTDPIEKKPLFHYLPGSLAFSIAAAGCNFSCKFCQNWEISQARPEEIPHESLTSARAIEICHGRSIPTIAYTYSEPTVFYTYMYDMSKAARAAGIGSVMISNGFMNEKPLRELCAHLTAVKIDLKSFSDTFYRDICSGELEPVLSTLKTLKAIGIWFEIVVLLIPTLNDSPDEIKKMCVWIKTNLGPDVPIHFSRFRPMYHIQNLPPTPVKTLEAAREIALSSGLHFPYIGNVPGHEGENTWCPSCKKTIIRRVGYAIEENMITKGKCALCGCPIPGVWGHEAVLL